MRLLRVASQPGNSMPAALRITLRPPSAPTRYFARIVVAVAEHDVDAVVVLDEAGDLAAALDPNAELLDPVREDRLDTVLPQRQAHTDAGSESR